MNVNMYYKSLVLNNNEGYLLKLYVPGYGKDDLKIEIEDSLLTIRGEELEKSFSIPDSIDLENVSAKCDKGILEIKIPKKVVKRNVVIEAV